jgi:hypothetical protein
LFDKLSICCFKSCEIFFVTTQEFIVFINDFDIYCLKLVIFVQSLIISGSSKTTLKLANNHKNVSLKKNVNTVKVQTAHHQAFLSKSFTSHQL